MPESDARPVSARRGDRLFRRLLASDAALDATAALIAGALRFVAATSRIVMEPRPAEAFFADYAPFIATTWHGQGFAMPVLRPDAYPTDVLASRNRDGEIVARTLLRLKCGVIRGSGASDPARMHEKGAVASFRSMKAALDAGRSVVLTADFMKDARRQVSPGIVALARLSGRPVIPVAIAPSRRWDVRSWDETTLPLPFGRIACVFGEPLSVARDVDETAAEAARQTLEARIDEAFARAYEIADGKA
jgi:lysophospholipid acyltransferase (LPLAT)-like uncharacterized protein